MKRRLIGLFCYGAAVAIPLAFAFLSKWYLGVWGFAFPLDAMGWFVILLMTGPFSALFIIFGSMLRKGSGQHLQKRVE